MSYIFDLKKKSVVKHDDYFLKSICIVAVVCLLFFVLGSKANSDEAKLCQSRPRPPRFYCSRMRRPGEVKIDLLLDEWSC